MDQVASLSGIKTQTAGTIDQQVGTRLRCRREELDVTMGDIAAALNVTPAEMDAIENGIERASAVQIRTLCAILAMTPADVLGGLG